MRVGDPLDLPLGSKGPALLTWAEREGRILITEDVNTMPVHLVHHVHAGRHSPGLLVISAGYSIREIVDYLELAAHAGEPTDYADAITYIP